MRLFCLTVLGALVVVLGACSPSTPRILQDYSRLTYLQDGDSQNPREVLSLFLQVDNKDGLEDLEKIFILQDKSELYWTLEPGVWQRRDREGEVWIGSNFLSSPLGTLPRGEYRVILQTKSGERARTTVYLDSPALEEYSRPIPKVTPESGSLRIDNPPETYELWISGADGQQLYTYKSQGESQIPASSFLPSDDIRQRARQLTFHRFEERTGVSLILGPYPIKY